MTRSPTDPADDAVIRTDLPLHVTARGEGDHAFVLLHGYGGSSYTWRHWMPQLAARGRVFAVDMKGFGQAPKPRDDHYSPADLASLVSNFLVEQDLSRVTLLGHSLGGGVALLSTLQRRDRGEDRIRRLALIGAAAYPQRLPPFVPLSKRPRLAWLLMRGVGTKRVVRWVMHSIVHDPTTVTREQVAAYARPLQSRDGLSAVMAAGRQIVPTDLESVAKRYREVDVPTLLLWGDHDRVIPRWVGERLATEMPGGTLVVLEKCGHVPPEEHPIDSWRVLEDFLNATDGESSAG